MKLISLRSSPQGLQRVIQIIILISLSGANTLVNASVSLERTIKEEGDTLAAVSALLAGNEGRLLVLDSEKGIFSEYRGKAGTRYNLITKKVFESEDVRGMTQLDENSYLVSNRDVNVIAMAVLPGNKIAVADIENKKIEIYLLPKNSYKVLKKLYLPTIAYERSIKLDCTKAYRLRGGNVLCLDAENNKVASYKSSGKKVKDFEGKFSDLVAASIDDQNIVILDGEKIKYYKLDGGLRFEVGGSGDIAASKKTLQFFVDDNPKHPLVADAKQVIAEL